MTMTNAFFSLPENSGITAEEIEENISACHSTICEVRELPAFNGEVGAPQRTVKIYLHISEMADLKETMEQGIGAKLLLAW